MVWFQCEDCGENLKKPKLAVHFNRCSAYKLSCIDCGVVFDQKSVQAHSSCVSEAEKYGPKGVNKNGTGHTPKQKSGKEQNGHDIDFSRGLSTSPPWSCSLCNIKATSQDTLVAHAVGKKHQSRCKAAAAKEKSNTGGVDAGVVADMVVDGGKKDDEKVQIKDVQAKAALDATSLSAEKKRKQKRTGEGDDLTSLPSGNVEKKPKRGGTSTDLGMYSTEKEDEMLLEAGKDTQAKKRKHVEEQDEVRLEGTVQPAGCKKSKKKGNQTAPSEVNGDVDAPKVRLTSGVVGKHENGEQVKKKRMKGSLEDVCVSPLGNGSLSDSKEQTVGIEGAGDVDCGLTVGNGSKSINGKTVTDKKTKKLKVRPDTPYIGKGLVEPRKVQRGDICKLSKKERKNLEGKEAIIHEISFREWLGEEEATHGDPPQDVRKGKENLDQVEAVEKAKQSEKSGTDSAREGSAKVVKWKKIIREVLAKLGQSLNGKLKKIELKKAVLPLAQTAVESASISVDRKALKAELMRQVTKSPKFVVDGKHVMLAPKV